MDEEARQRCEKTDKGSGIRWGLWDDLSAKLGQGLYWYLGMEIVWHTTLMFSCLRFKPLLLLSKTQQGLRFQSWMSRLTKIDIEAAKSRNSTARATIEWTLFNKVVGLPLWPSKVYLGVWLGENYGPNPFYSSVQVK